MWFIALLSELKDCYSVTGFVNSLLFNNDPAINWGSSVVSALITGFAFSFTFFGFVDDASGFFFVTLLFCGDGLTATLELFWATAEGFLLYMLLGVLTGSGLVEGWGCDPFCCPLYCLS